MGLKKQFSELITSDLYQNIMKLLSGNIVARIIPMILAIGLARIYAPDDFGDFLLLLSIASVFSIFTTAKYDSPVIIAENETLSNNIYAYGLKLNFLLNILLLIFGSIIVYFSRIDLVSLKQLSLIVAYSFLFGSMQFLRAKLTREKNFGSIAKVEIVRSVAIGGFQFLFYNQGAIGLMLGATLGQLVPILLLLRNKGYLPLGLIRQQSIFRNENAKRFIRFPKFSMPSELLNFVSSQLPVFVFKPMFGSQLMGSYSFGHRYISIPIQLFSRSVSDVLVEKVVALKNSADELNRTITGLFKKQFLLGIIPFSVLGLWGKDIFIFVFGIEWEQAGFLAQLISPWLFMVMLGSPLSAILTAYEKQKYSMVFNFLLISFRVAAILVGYFIFDSIFYAVGLYSIVGSTFFFILAAYALSLVKVKIRYLLPFIFKTVLVVLIPLILLKFIL